METTFIFVYGNGKVDRTGLIDRHADTLQQFVDASRRSPRGVPCVLMFSDYGDDTFVHLYEETATLQIGLAEHQARILPTKW